MKSFEEQLKYREKFDDHVFQDAILSAGDAVIGERLAKKLENKKLVKSAIDAILRSYYIKPKFVDPPSDLKSIDDLINFYIKPYGIQYRKVKLSKGWHKDAIGPMLTTKKSDGSAVALVPHYFSGYSYFDLETNKSVKINKRNEDLFDEEAIFFYPSFPTKKLRIRDFIFFILKLFSMSDMLLYVGMFGITALLGLLSPLFTYLLFGPTIQSQSINALIGVAVFMISFAISQSLINIYQTLINERIGVKIDISVEAAVMSRILSLPASFFKKYSSGDLAQRSKNVQTLCKTLMNSVLASCLSSLFSLVYVSQVFQYTPALAVPAMLIVLGTITVTIFTILLQMHITKKKMELHAEEGGMSYSMITGIQKIKLAGAYKRTFARWANLYSKIAKLEYNPPALIKFSSLIILAVSLFGTLLLYTSAIYNNVSVADYYAFNTAFGMINGAFSGLTGVIGALATIKPTLEIIKPIMEASPEISENKNTISNLSGEIDISNICFKYNEDMPNVLENFSLKINPGEYVGIVGETGCGKSTLLRLLLGFEFPQKGAIYYDRNSTKDIDLRSLCQNIGVVLQDGKLFIGDIFSNIAIACPGLTLDGAWEAAKIAQIDKDIKDMPMGMHTMISEGQGGISGGQKQRLMIARAVASKPKIIMLDESTSALDNVTQKNVSDAIDSLKCTRIVIAHRLSTIKNCDRIVVLKDGNIAEEGSYDELISKNGVFAELVKRQRLDIEC